MHRDYFVTLISGPLPDGAHHIPVPDTTAPESAGRLVWVASGGVGPPDPVERTRDMSTWDESVFTDEAATDFLDECDDLEQADYVAGLVDACTVALNHASRGTDDFRTGLCAATVAAIWAGAPFTAADEVDAHPAIRAGIGECPEELQTVALQLLDRELEQAGDEAPDGLETVVEALS